MATLRSSLLLRLRQLLSGKAAMGSALRFGDSESVSVSFSIVSQFDFFSYCMDRVLLDLDDDWFFHRD